MALTKEELANLPSGRFYNGKSITKGEMKQAWRPFNLTATQYAQVSDLIEARKAIDAAILAGVMKLSDVKERYKAGKHEVVVGMAYGPDKPVYGIFDKKTAAASRKDAPTIEDVAA